MCDNETNKVGEQVGQAEQVGYSFGSAARAAHEASKLRRFAVGLPLAARDVEFEPNNEDTQEESNARPEKS